MAVTESFVATSLAWAFAIRAGVWRPRVRLRPGHAARPPRASAPPPAAPGMLVVAQGSIDSIVVGRQLGTEALGQYSLGYRFLFLPLDRLLDAIGGVLEPVLATLQDDLARFQDTLLRVERYVCALYVPLTIGDGRRRPRPRCGRLRAAVAARRSRPADPVAQRAAAGPGAAPRLRLRGPRPSAGRAGRDRRPGRPRRAGLDHRRPLRHRLGGRRLHRHRLAGRRRSASSS